MPPPPRAALARPAAVVPAGGGGGAEPTRHLLALPLWCPAGGLAFFVACLPCLSFCFCPLSPRPPSPAGKGENQSFLMQGASPLASPALDRLRHLQSLPLWCPQGEGGVIEPRRHLFSLPRGRGPSQTPKFLSPGPPSPWLPALLIGNRFLSFLRATAGSLRRVPAWQRL